MAALGALSSILIIYRILDHPSASASLAGYHASGGIRFGIWLGLVAALTIAWGGYLQARAEDASPPALQPHGEQFSGLALGRGARSTEPPEPPEQQFSGITLRGGGERQRRSPPPGG